MGLTSQEISAERDTNDMIELSDEIMPHMHVYDAFHAESELIPVARLNGVTNVIVAPQSQDTLPDRMPLYNWMASRRMKCCWCATLPCP